MLHEKIIKISTVLIICSLVITLFLTYGQYQQVCNNQQQYQGVETIYSKNAYKICGPNFSIVNRGQDPIKVETRTIDDQDVGSEDIRENSTITETDTLEQGQSISIDADNDIVYIIENEIGSNLDHTIGLQKIS